MDPAWREKVGERNVMEDSMLEFADNVDPTSRLSCQVKVAEGLDGVIVRLPESQH